MVPGSKVAVPELNTCEAIGALHPAIQPGALGGQDMEQDSRFAADILEPGHELALISGFTTCCRFCCG